MSDDKNKLRILRKLIVMRVIGSSLDFSVSIASLCQDFSFLTNANQALGLTILWSRRYFKCICRVFGSAPCLLAFENSNVDNPLGVVSRQSWMIRISFVKLGSEKSHNQPYLWNSLQSTSSTIISNVSVCRVLQSHRALESTRIFRRFS